MINPIILSLFIILPLVGSFISSFFATLIPNKKYLIFNQSSAVLILLADVVLAGYMSLEFIPGSTLTFSMSSFFSVNSFSLLVLILVQVVFFLVSIFSTKYITPTRQSQYFIFFFSLNLGINLTLLANNLFVLFISWELMVISGYVLVSFNKSAEAFEAGFKYLVISSVGSLFILLGIGLVTGLVGSLDFTAISAKNILSNELGILALTFITIGFATTGGAFIFNQWLPDAHPEAPAPVSALLSGIVVNMGIYGLYRTFTIFSLSNGTYATNISEMIVLLGLLTMFEGSIMVFVQFRKDSIDLKRILAYSTISHMGLLLTLTPLNSQLGLLALVYHIFSHSLSKSLLFLMAGYLQLTYGTRNIKSLAGVGRKDIPAGIFIVIGLFSLGGFPGTTGFISELLAFIAIFSSGIASNFALSLVIVLAVIFNSILAFGGYLWLMKILVFNLESQTITSINDSISSHKTIEFTMLVFSALIILMGLFPNIVINYISSLLF